VEEAFTNIRLHSGASRVTLTVTIGRANLRTVVEDDGQGFDVERTLVQAARAGHLGLVGMGERMRLLGGRLDVESALGGPTTVTATIPRWEPPASE
jgi:two-component system sensor histidine kinase DegS